MIFDKSYTKLPKIYKRDGKNCYLDPFRKNLVPVTKEETIRQKVAGYFRDVLQVPEEYIFTEDSLKHWNVNSNDRADIIIGYEDAGQIYSLGIVECKAPDINLSSQTYSQCQRYIDLIGGKYIFITNGNDIFVWYHDSNKTEELRQLPTYEEMLSDNISVIKSGSNAYYRYSLEEIENMSPDEFLDTGFIGEDTPKHLWKHIVNLGDCFLDQKHFAVKKQFNGIKIVDDLGCVYLNYDDASGGGFGSGFYRSLLIEDNQGNNQIISFSIIPTGKTINDSKYGNSEGKSVLVVSFQEFKTDYTVVQINLNRFMRLESDMLTLWHNGAVMQKGGRKDDLIKKVQAEYPLLVKDGMIYLGSLPSDEMMYMDSQKVSETICNIIAYSLIRNEYKESLRHKNSHPS